MTFSNIKDATQYTYDQLREVNPDIIKEWLYDNILDEVIQSSEYILSDEDLDLINQHLEDGAFVDAYLQKKIPDYSQLLSDIVLDMVSEEVLATA